MNVFVSRLVLLACLSFFMTATPSRAFAAAWVQGADAARKAELGKAIHDEQVKIQHSRFEIHAQEEKNALNKQFVEKQKNNPNMMPQMVQVAQTRYENGLKVRDELARTLQQQEKKLADLQQELAVLNRK